VIKSIHLLHPLESPILLLHQLSLIIPDSRVYGREAFIPRYVHSYVASIYARPSRPQIVCESLPAPNLGNINSNFSVTTFNFKAGIANSTLIVGSRELLKYPVVWS
jgi:hypothetical protein